MSTTEENMDGTDSHKSIDFIIGQKVRQHRERHNMSVAAFCSLVGMKSGAFLKLETGFTRWRVELLLRCAEALNVSFLDLLPEDVSKGNSVSNASPTPVDPAIARMAERVNSLSPHSFKAIEMLIDHFEDIDSSK
jgi:transcriptional regulator with XRE-family HTH domain|tara:strand:+ start:1317 stop:1721 length:405 start_codon:yes stop_codon:yes gene_type:complete